MPCRVPLEIVHMIMDNLKSSPRTLYNCGLTCHAWYNISRGYLPERLELKTYAEYNELLRTVTRSGGKGGRSRVNGIVAFEDQNKPYVHSLLQQTGHYLTYADVLTLYNCDWQRRQGVLNDGFFGALGNFTHLTDLLLFNCSFPTIGVLRRLMWSLPKLQGVQMENVSWNPLGRPDPNPRPAVSTDWGGELTLADMPEQLLLDGNTLMVLAQLFKHIGRLTLRRIRFSDFSDIQRLVHIFPAIDVLSFEDVSFETQQTTASPQTQSPDHVARQLRLRDLSLQVACREHFAALVDWLVEVSVPQVLQFLTLGSQESVTGAPYDIMKLWQTFGPYTRTLRVTSPQLFNYQQEYYDRSFADVYSFSFILNEWTDDSWETLWDSVARILSQIRGWQPPHIDFYVHSKSRMQRLVDPYSAMRLLDTLNARDYTFMEEIIWRDEFSALDEVTFYFWSGSIVEKVDEAIRRALVRHVRHVFQKWKRDLECDFGD